MFPLVLSPWTSAAIGGVQSWANHFAAAVEQNFSTGSAVAPAVCDALPDQFLMAASDAEKKGSGGFPSYDDLLPPDPFHRPDEFLKAWEALPGWVTLGMGQNVQLVARRPDAMQVLRKIVGRCRQGVTLTQVRHAAVAVSNFVRREEPKKELAAAKVGDKLFTSGKKEPSIWDETTLSGLVEWSGPTPKGITLYLKTPIG